MKFSGRIFVLACREPEFNSSEVVGIWRKVTH